MTSSSGSSSSALLREKLSVESTQRVTTGMPISSHHSTNSRSFAAPGAVARHQRLPRGVVPGPPPVAVGEDGDVPRQLAAVQLGHQPVLVGGVEEPGGVQPVHELAQPVQASHARQRIRQVGPGRGRAGRAPAAPGRANLRDRRMASCRRPRPPLPSRSPRCWPRSSPGSAAGCTPALTPLALAAGIVLVVLAPTTAGKVGGAVFLAGVGAAVRHQRALPPAHLGRPRRGRHAPARPRQHLRLHRGQLHPDGAADAARAARGSCCCPSSGWRPWAGWPSGCSGCTHPAGSTPRSTSCWPGRPWAGSAPSTAPAGRPWSLLILAGGLFYTAGAVVYAPQAARTPRRRGSASTRSSTPGTVLGFVCHYVAISLVTYAAR